MVLDVEKVRSELQWDDGWKKRLVIQTGALFIKAMFYNRKMSFGIEK